MSCLRSQRAVPPARTETLTYHIYARMFEAGQIGTSAAIAYVLFFITLAIVIFLFTQLERGDQELVASTSSRSLSAAISDSTSQEEHRLCH